MLKQTELVELLGSVKIVMVETSNPGNIGAAARAMKNMGLSHLRLVNPKEFPSSKAFIRASSAADLLHNAQVFSSLKQAIADCHITVATTARVRRIGYQALEVREMVKKLLEELKSMKISSAKNTAKSIAIIFGRESSGLTNDELDLCLYYSSIKTSQSYTSLNVAAAIQIYSYELLNQINPTDLNDEHARPKKLTKNSEIEKALATREQIEFMLEHFFALLEKVGFNTNSKILSRRIRIMFMKTVVTVREVQILRGIYTKIIKGLK